LPACAQVSATVSVESDYRYRGYSLSDERPTAIAQLGYDHSSGLYANVAAFATFGRDSDVYFLGAQGNAGYVKRLNPRLYLDMGVTHSEYDPIAPDRGDWRYTEVYVGLGTDQITGRISYSPHYFIADTETVYTEVEGALEPSENWRLNAHAGALFYLSAPYFIPHDTYYDWRVGVSRRFGHFDLHAALSSGGPGKDYYGSTPRNRTAFTVGASWSL